MKSLRLFRVAIWGLCLLSSGPLALAQQSTPDSYRHDIEVARQKVYPALVNISVVVRYFSEGRARRAPAGGSGVIVSKEGLVLTNFHVAGNTTRITCTLPDGEAIDAAVLLHDPLTDLSVLKLHVEKRKNPNLPLPYAVLGDSDKLQIGDPVIAMGNPMMLSSSMTLGVVSNTKRVFTDFTNTQLEDQELDGGEKTGLLTRWIQHDALILPGNSGGPLVNLKGEVVGINELGGNGVGFAIPARIAGEVLKASAKGNSVTRGWLGVSILPVDKLQRTTGALISAVLPGSPAEKAGLQPGDIIISVNDQSVNVRFFEEVPLFQQLTAALTAGQTAKIKYERNQQPHDTNVAIALMEPSVGREEEVRDMGVSVQEITGPMAMARRMVGKEGVLVTGVRPGYPFEGAQPPIAAGDVIVKIGDVATPNPDVFRKALANVGSLESFAVTLRRRKEEILTVVKIPPVKPTEEGTELPKAWLGLKTQVLTTDVAKALKMPDTKGFRITEVLPLTTAVQAGFRAGDIITGINKDKLNSFRPQDGEDLRRLVEDLPIGKMAEFSIVRDGKPIKITAQMEAAPASGELAKKAKQKELEFSVRDIMPMDRIEKRLSKDQKGVLITEATAGGWANVAGLLVDDILLSINGQIIEDVASFERVIKEIIKQKPKVVQMLVRRDGRTHFVFIEPDWQKLVE